MAIHQISVFLENRAGQLAEITALLAKNGNPKHFGAFTSAAKTKKITDGCIRQPPVKNSALRNQKL